MVSAFYMLSWPNDADPHCEVLMHRTYHNRLPSSIAIIRNFEEAYKQLAPHERTPVLYHKGISYIYIHTAGVFFVAVATRNPNAMLLVIFLHNFCQILTSYLVDARKKQQEAHKKSLAAQKTLEPVVTIRPVNPATIDRDAIIDNLVLIFDLLDECMDFGVVQLTDYNILKEYIKMQVNLPRVRADHDVSDSESESDSDTGKVKSTRHKRTKSKDVRSTYNQANIEDVMNQDTSLINSSVLRTYSLGINWRPKGIFYTKNEIYIDVVESCELLYDLETRAVKKNEVAGTCYVKCYLSGMPLCKLGFNEKNISGIDNLDTKNSDENRQDSKKYDAEDKHDDQNDDQRDNQHDDQHDHDKNELNNQNEDSSLKHDPLHLSDNQLVDADVEVMELEDAEEHSTKPKHLISIRNIQFHQCIKLNALYRENLLTFVPPDDRFVLMTYNVELQNHLRKPPIVMVEPTYRADGQTLRIMCVMTINVKKRLHCTSLIVKLPINPNLFVVDTQQLKYKAEIGEVSYKLDSSELYWAVNDVTGRKTVRMMAELPLTKSASTAEIHASLNNTLVHENAEEETPEQELDSFYGVNGTTSSLRAAILDRIRNTRSFNYVHVTFKVPMMSYSGLKLNYLKVEEELMRYACFPWVKYVTEAADSQDNSYRFKLSMRCFDLGMNE